MISDMRPHWARVRDTNKKHNFEVASSASTTRRLKNTWVRHGLLHNCSFMDVMDVDEI
jgi:hypothetical protein